MQSFRLKSEDKITVEITLGELAKVMALEGRCNGTLPFDLYRKAEEVFGIEGYNHELDTFLDRIGITETICFSGREDEFLSFFLPKETEQHKQIRELKETIKKAQQQIEALEKQ